MKHFILLLLAAVAVVRYSVADEWTDSKKITWKYTVSNGEATVTDCPSMPWGEVTIPEKMNGIPVVKIAGNTFKQYFTHMTSIVIPDSVREIDVSAFEGCTALSNVVIGAGVKTITSTTFRGCESIKSVTLKSIPTVRYASVVTGDWILESEDSTVRTAVYRCPSVQAYGKAKMQYQIVVNGNSGYVVFDWRVSSSMSRYAKLYWYLDGVQQTGCRALPGGTEHVSKTVSKGTHIISWEYSMDGNVTGGGDAWVEVSTPLTPFMDSTVKNIFPDSYAQVTTVVVDPLCSVVPKNFFDDCVCALRIDTPSIFDWLQYEFEARSANPLSIGAKLYVGDELLTNLIVPDGVERIGPFAFSDCNTITNLELSATVNDVEPKAFVGCNHISTATFKSLPQIPDVISGDWTLESRSADGTTVYRSPHIEGYNSTAMQVQVYGPRIYSFRWKVSCRNLSNDFATDYNAASLALSLDGSGMNSISGEIGWDTIAIRVPSGKHIVKWSYVKRNYAGGSDCGWVEVRPGATQIPLADVFPDSYAKFECVRLGNAVTMISENLFAGCAKLTETPITDSVLQIADGAFKQCRSLTTVVVPKSVSIIGASAFAQCTSLSSIWFKHLIAPNVNDSAFSGVPSSCKIYVKRDSKGWGVEIPGVWKGVNIDYATYDVILDATGGNMSSPKVVVDMGDPYNDLPVPTKGGYLFDGWYTAREGGVKVLASDIPTGDTTLYAHWTIIPYTITYSELHGAANPNPVQYTVEDSVSFGALSNLPGRKFVGWSPDNIPLGSVGDVDVMALWQDVEVNNVLGETVSTGGDADWFVAWDGANPILRSGAIVKKQSSWMEMSFEDAARVSFEWKASCEDLGGASERTDGMTVEIDGVEAGFICGETGWIAETNLVSGEGTHKIRWTYAKDAKTDVGEDCAWVRNVTVMPLRSVSFDVGGAEEGVAPEAIFAYVGDRYVLPDNGTLKKAKHTFVGWQFGNDVLAAGTWCVMPTNNVIYTAVWSAKVLDAPCITAPVVYDEESALVSISAAEGTTIYYTLDGSVPSANNGTRYMGAFRVTGTAKVSAVAVLDDWYDSVVAQVVTTRSWTTLEDSLGVDDAEFTITTGGSANWIGDRANACVKSTGDGWLNAAFVGPCVVAWEERTGAGDWSAKRQVFAEEGVKEIIWEGASLSVRGLQRLAVRRVDFASGESTSGEVPQGTCPVSIYDAAGFPFELPSADGLSVPKHRFEGWKLGEDVFAVGSQCVMPTYDVTYVGVWEAKKLSAPVIEVASQYSTEKTTFSVSQQEGANVYYTLDGSNPSSEHGLLYTGVVEIEGSVTIRAVAALDDWFESEVVTVSTIRLPWTASECLNATDFVFEFGGDAEWKRDLQESHDGAASLRSGTIGNYQTSEIRTTVPGPGELSFWYKASSEFDESDGEPYDGLMVYIDDVAQGDLMGGNIQWANVCLKVSGNGDHTVRWVYEKDKSGSGGKDCVWLDEIVWKSMLNPAIEGDEGATVTGDAETGFVIKPSAGNTVVEVTIPQGVDAAKVTVEVSPKVASVKPNGAKVKIVSGDADITEFLNVPAADGDGVVDLTKATVKEEIVKEAMDVKKGAKIELDAANPSLTTPNTRKGLFYQLREGATLGGMKEGDSTIGDGNPWKPEIKVKGGNSAFYSIGVGKGN